MNKYAIALAGMAMTAAGVFAATPNRLLVTDTQGSKHGYVIDRVDKVEFATIEGAVEAPVQIHEIDETAMLLSVTRSADCDGFKIGIIPDVVFSGFKDDLQAINYINYYSPTVYFEDFDHGQLSGMEVSKGSDYRVVTVGVDKYGIDCGVCSAKFSVGAEPVVGNPQVKCSVVSTGLTEFTIKFEPNADVSEYYYIAEEKGKAQESFEMFAGMFGFTNINEMIESWGVGEMDPSTYTWTKMSPNTDYEILIALKDKKGNFAPYQTFEVSTLAKGGKGEAVVDVAVSKYELADWGGQMLPSLYVKYTPNDQTWCYRFGVYTQADIDQYGEQALIDDLCSDPDMPMANWFFYDAMETDYQVNPNTKVIIYAAGKNSDGEWGKVTKFTYTTPALATATPEAATLATAAAKAVTARTAAPQPRQQRPGLLPARRPGLTLK